MKKKASVTLISVVAILLVSSSSMAIDTVPLPERQRTLQGTPAQTTPVQLKDPTTGQIIGYYDRIKRVLVFNKRNMAIPRNLITRVSDRTYQLLMQIYNEMMRTNLKCYNGRIPVEAPIIIYVDGVAIEHPPSGLLGGGGGSSGVSSSSENCLGLCWYMAEGGAWCKGCCIPVSQDACNCWEECSDYTSSLAQ